jgi:hypothetical protein
MDNDVTKPPPSSLPLVTYTTAAAATEGLLCQRICVVYWGLVDPDFYRPVSVKRQRRFVTVTVRLGHVCCSGVAMAVARYKALHAGAEMGILKFVA